MRLIYNTCIHEKEQLSFFENPTGCIPGKNNKDNREDDGNITLPKRRRRKNNQSDSSSSSSSEAELAFDLHRIKKKKEKQLNNDITNAVSSPLSLCLN